MKSLGSDKSAAKAEKSTSTEAASDGNNNGFFTANDKIDFSNVKVEHYLKKLLTLIHFLSQISGLLRLRNVLQFLSQRSYFSLL